MIPGLIPLFILEYVVCELICEIMPSSWCHGLAVIYVIVELHCHIHLFVFYVCFIS